MDVNFEGVDKVMNIGIFPFGDSIISILRYQRLLRDYKICLILDFKGNILKENEIKKQSSYACRVVGIEWSYINNNDRIDALVVSSDINKLETSKILAVIDLYCKKGVDIITLGVKDDVEIGVSKLCEKYNNNHFSSRDLINDGLNYRNLEYTLEIRDVETPVIAVSGVAPMTQKEHIVFSLVDSFKKDGYRVSFIGTGCFNEMLGGYSFDEVVHGRDIPEVHRIAYLNSFIKEMEKKENPDVIIIGVEDPIIPLSRKHTFNNGIYALEMFNAVKPDISIVSLMNGEYNDDFYEQIGLLCKYKYNHELTACFISRYVVMSSSLSRYDLSYAYTDFIENKSDLYPIFSDIDIENALIYGFVLRKLQQYGRCEQL